MERKRPYVNFAFEKHSQEDDVDDDDDDGGEMLKTQQTENHWNRYDYDLPEYCTNLPTYLPTYLPTILQLQTREF